jgi:hypothetical protein
MSLLSNVTKRDSPTRFFTPVFFTKRIIQVSIGMPKSDFKICRILVELFVLKLSKNRLPAVNDSGESKTEPQVTHIFYSLELLLVSNTLHG